jgi:hypothetical protein
VSYARSDAETYLAGEHASLFTELSVATSDTQPGIKSILDRAFRLLGVGQADLATAVVADSDVEKLEAALDYHALLRFTREASPRVHVLKVTAGNRVQKNAELFYEHLVEALKEAKLRCKVLGVPVDGGGFEWGAYSLDFLEPQYPSAVGYDD